MFNNVLPWTIALIFDNWIRNSEKPFNPQSHLITVAVGTSSSLGQGKKEKEATSILFFY